MADARGRPVQFALPGGQASDARQAIPLLTGIRTIAKSSHAVEYAPNPSFPLSRESTVPTFGVPLSPSGRMAIEQLCNRPVIGIDAGCVIADKGYESNRTLEFMRSQGATVVIPHKANRRDPWEYDRELDREWNLFELAFNKLKHWRRIATRYDRKSINSLNALLGILDYLGIPVVDSSQY